MLTDRRNAAEGRGDTRIAEEDGTVKLHLGDHDVDLALVAKAGKADPAPPRTSDPPDYRTKARTTFAATTAVARKPSQLKSGPGSGTPAAANRSGL